jgi:hypothetical protein
MNFWATSGDFGKVKMYEILYLEFGGGGIPSAQFMFLAYFREDKLGVLQHVESGSCYTCFSVGISLNKHVLWFMQKSHKGCVAYFSQKLTIYWEELCQVLFATVTKG